MAADTAVDRITDDRVADAVQMDTDLVGSACGDGDCSKRKPTQSFGSGHPGDRRSRSARSGRHFLPVHKVATEWGVDAAPGVQEAPHQGDIFLVDFPVCELAR